MSEKYIIEFTRDKTEMKKIYFGKLFKKQIWVYVIRLICLIPISILFGIFFTVATEMLFNLGDKGNIWLIIVWTLIIIYPFANPIFKLYRQYKKQLKESFETKESLKTIFEFDETNFKYQNEIYELKTTWDNSKLLKIDSDYTTFQTMTPNLQFWIPTEKIPEEAKDLIKSKIVKK